MTTRVCVKCEVAKPETDFYKSKKSASGYDRKCKGCSDAYVRAWRENNRVRNAENAKAWAAKNPGKIKASAAIQYAKSKDTILARVSDWVRENPDRRRLNARAWVVANPHKANANTARYRATKRKSTPSWSIEFFVTEAYHLAKLRELICGGKWEVDHIVPLRSRTVCGLHAHTNIRVIRKASNMTKGNRFWPDMPC